MKALTIRQPWASLIALGVKTLETRSWPTYHRGPLAIHAAASALDGHDHGHLWTEPLGACIRGLDVVLPNPAELPRGAIVATCELMDVARIVGDFLPKDNGRRYLRPLGSAETRLDVSPGELPFGDYSLTGRYAWLLDNIVALDEPIPAKGRQGLWEWSA